MPDIELSKNESLIVVYVRVRQLLPTKNWAATLVSTGKEYQAPTRAMAVHIALSSVGVQ